ncbi:Lrp/AsnC family transcriptional regulator [Luteimicrobium subarcticum]|uniref:DNA-binding Lrp family transcriptional regulator n=1 Tax=Luteimicrobium subarcticum TaxID=620910 RepID=A0A2M8WW19_9MICO|nr:Lrp/AsnC family transcriptional regulator [Luteimicrobium subarcticum]PJI95119.1 DNA-binding Lrp family transcriptional regulator [Luteimicrobium subarcticum]
MPQPELTGAPDTRKIRLDELDEKILWELARDADTTNAALAERLHVSPSTTHARVRALRAAGVLGTAHADVDYRAVGLPLQAIVAVRLRAQARTVIKSFAAKMARHPNVLDVFFVGGQDDFLVRVVTTSPEQLRDFVAGPLSSDPVVASTETQIVFDHLRGLAHWGGDDGAADGFDELRGPIA